MEHAEDRTISILLADETAVHERLVNVLRRRAPRVLLFSVAACGESGRAHARTVVRGTQEETSRVVRYVEKIIGVEEVEMVPTTPHDPFVGVVLPR